MPGGSNNSAKRGGKYGKDNQPKKTQDVVASSSSAADPNEGRGKGSVLDPKFAWTCRVCAEHNEDRLNAAEHTKCYYCDYSHEKCDKYVLVAVPWDFIAESQEMNGEGLPRAVRRQSEKELAAIQKEMERVAAKMHEAELRRKEKEQQTKKKERREEREAEAERLREEQLAEEAEAEEETSGSGKGRGKEIDLPDRSREGEVGPGKDHRHPTDNGEGSSRGSHRGGGSGSKSHSGKEKHEGRDKH